MSEFPGLGSLSPIKKGAVFIPDPKTLQLRVGETLSRLREGRNLTLIEVAHRMGEGSSSTAQIESWERGEASPLAHQLWAYLLAVDSSFTDLGYELDPRPATPGLQEIARELDALGRESA